MFIQTVAENQAEGKLREFYESDLKSNGYVANTTKVMSLQPEIIETWRAFQGSIRKTLRLRTYELVTMAAAGELKCRYCLLAHGSILLKNGFTVEQVRAIISNHHSAGLEPVEVAMMDFAKKLIHNANDVTHADVDHLKSLGLTDTEVLDITLAATMRSFMSKTLDTLGTEPDAVYDDLATKLGDLLPAVKI